MCNRFFESDVKGFSDFKAHLDYSYKLNFLAHFSQRTCCWERSNNLSRKVRLTTAASQFWWQENKNSNFHNFLKGDMNNEEKPLLKRYQNKKLFCTLRQFLIKQSVRPASEGIFDFFLFFENVKKSKQNIETFFLDWNLWKTKLFFVSYKDEALVW